MRSMKLMCSSQSSEWETPQVFFDELNAEFGFTLDVCATPDNAKCAVFFTENDDGLNRDWDGVCWMNPPYGRQIGKWVQKAAEESVRGSLVVGLLPARTDTAWWHDYVIPFSREIRFIRGRLKFGGSQYNAPFPNAVVVFGSKIGGAPNA